MSTKALMNDGGPPACLLCFGLGAEPALALQGLDPHLAVPGAPGHVIDVAVLRDVALDGAAAGRRFLGARPTFLAKDPRGLGLALPNAGVPGAGLRLGLDIARRILDERPREARPHHLRIDVAAIGEAHAEDAIVFVPAAALAIHATGVDQRGQLRARGRTAAPLAPILAS